MVTNGDGKMNNDMKCPFCNRNLHKGEDGIYSHLDYMTECKGRLFDGSKELWQELIKLMEDKDLSDKIGKLETELDRTRKALDVAVDALNAGKTLADIAGFKMLVAGLEEALNKITALEQKDVK